MSYRSRESKRKKKAAVAQAKHGHSAAMASRYYLTKAKHACRCSRCGAKLRMKATWCTATTGR
jgi:hypothetical protein